MSNAEHANPNLTITLGDKKFSISPSFHMFMLYEQHSGKNGIDPLTWLSPTATDIAILIWAAIDGEEYGMTVKDVAKLLNGDSVQELTKLIQELFKRSQTPANIKNEDAVS